MVKESDESEKQGKEPLPSDLVRLIHYVELNRSGWWKSAMQTLIQVTLWKEGVATDVELRGVLAASLGAAIDAELFDEALADLVAGASVLHIPDGRFKASEELGAQLSKQGEEVAQSQERVEERFVSCMLEAGIDADPQALWDDFLQLFLLPFIADSGARTYELLSGKVDLRLKYVTYGDLVNPLCSRYGEEVRTGLVQFLDPGDTDVRAFLLRELNADFAREAVALDKSVLRSLSKSNGRPDRVRVLLDTNVVLSLLGLHDNPGNDMSDDLMALVSSIEPYIKVELAVLPITADETRRVLRDAISRLTGIIPHRNTARAAVSTFRSGLSARYFQVVAESGQAGMTADEFFGPYESNLVAVLRDHGVELYNENLDELRMDRQVIDDLNHEMELQGRKRPNGPKPYEANLHDMVLWHFAKRFRPAVAQTALDTSMWVCTLDYGLISFDRRKRRYMTGPPICLAPSSLIQLLQFWAPRSESVDKALVGAIREPLMFLNFDGPSEKTTLRIIKSIDRFEGVGDLSVEVISSVLSNEALQGKLESAAPDDQADLEKVELAFVDEAAKLEASIAAVAAERDELERERAELQKTSAIAISEGATEAERLRTELEAKTAAMDAVEAKLRSEREMHAETVQNVSKSQAQIEAKLNALEESQTAKRERTEVALFSCGAFMAAMVLCVAVYFLFRSVLPSVVLVVALSFVGAIGSLLTFERIASKRASLSNSRVVAVARDTRKLAWVVFWAIIASLLAAVLWDAFQ